MATKFPSKKELKEAREFLSKTPASRPLSKNASPVDRAKHFICEEFVRCCVILNYKPISERKV